VAEGRREALAHDGKDNLDVDGKKVGRLFMTNKNAGRTADEKVVSETLKLKRT